MALLSVPQDVVKRYPKVKVSTTIKFCSTNTEYITIVKPSIKPLVTM